MPENDETLNRKMPAALALAMGRSVNEAAEAAGVDPKTVYRWRSGNQKFKAKVRQLRQQVIDAALGRLLSSLTAACDTLTELLGPSHQENTRLRAAVALLDMASKYYAELDLTTRMAELERQVNAERRAVA
jgi:hypothetical protein